MPLKLFSKSPQKPEAHILNVKEAFCRTYSKRNHIYRFSNNRPFPIPLQCVRTITPERGWGAIVC